MIFRTQYALLIIPILLVYLFIRRKTLRHPGFVFPSGALVETFTGGVKAWVSDNRVYLRSVVIILVVLAAARPQLDEEKNIRKEGIGIIVAIDCSSTMMAKDIKLGLEALAKNKELKDKKEVTRIDAVREVAKDLVKTRTDDLIGLVAFAGDAYVVCPLTFDHKWVLKALNRIKIGMIKDGTAIGSGILSSVKCLKDAKAKSRIIVLLTDGINNSGQVPPLIAARTARALGIKIYTIGLVSGGEGFYDTGTGGRKKYKESEITVDEDSLREIARLTDGEYFRATDMASLWESYKEIDRLEKVEIEQKSLEDYTDVFWWFLIPAIILFVADIVLGNTFLRRIP